MPKELFHSVSNVIDEMDRIYALAASKANLSQSAFDILYTLYVFGNGCTQKELCEHCWASKQTINASVKRLAGQGYIELSQGRGHETHVSLTDKGRAVAEEKIAPFVRAEEASFEALSTSEQEQLASLLGRMRDSLRESLETAGLL